MLSMEAVWNAMLLVNGIEKAAIWVIIANRPKYKEFKNINANYQIKIEPTILNWIEMNLIWNEYNINKFVNIESFCKDFNLAKAKCMANWISMKFNLNVYRN